MPALGFFGAVLCPAGAATGGGCGFAVGNGAGRNGVVFFTEATGAEVICVLSAA